MKSHNIVKNGSKPNLQTVKVEKQSSEGKEENIERKYEDNYQK